MRKTDRNILILESIYCNNLGAHNRNVEHLRSKIERIIIITKNTNTGGNEMEETYKDKNLFLLRLRIYAVQKATTH
jgi:hypothetical protein